MESKPLSDAEIAELRRTIANPLLHLERVTDIAAALPCLLDEVTRARALLDQAVAMFAPGIEEDGKLWRLAEARGDLAKCISRGDFWERLPEAEAWLAAARSGGGETWHDRARALLKRLERSPREGQGSYGWAECPDCRRATMTRDPISHAPDCELAALIGGK